MNTKILGLRTAAYLVTDINAAKDWYSKAFEVTPYFDEPFYVGFNIGGYELGLMPDGQPSTEKPASVYVYWGVENIEKAFSRLLDLGAEAHENPQSAGGELKVASVKDPWGNILGIIYNPDFKIDKRS
jgi:lactoylglutathione lyase